MANRDLGIVRPLYNRWTWPFGMMEEGDWFLVDKMEREAERVRHLASVRAAQLGKRFKVEKHPADHPGFCKVMCVPDDYEPVDHHAPILSYGDGRERLRDLYGFELDMLRWNKIEDGHKVEVQLEALDEVPRPRMVIASYTDRFDVGVELFKDRLVFGALPKGWKPHVWAARSDEEIEQWRAELGKRLYQRDFLPEPSIGDVLD